jgi:transcription antitermination factor NusG
MLDGVPTSHVDSVETGSSHARNELPGGRYWAVCYTHPQAERWAAQNLTLRGYVTFLPLCTVRRRDRAVPTLFHPVRVPLFPRYVFAVIDGAWTPLRYCRGVRALLMDGDGHPHRLDAALVGTLQAMQEPAGDAVPWAAGTPCSLAQGPFAGHPGVVLGVKRDTASLAVMVLGALRTVSAPLSALVPRE